MRRFPLLIAAVFPLTACTKPGGAPASIPAVGTAGVTRFSYEVVRTWPHSPEAFTQGLLFHQESMIEGTGLNGRSSLREVDWKTGRVLKQVVLDPRYFGEGVTVLGSKVYQLTWQNHVGFVYDVDTFQKNGEFSYEGEGWGLTTDGKLLILSDGTNRLRFLDPATFAVVRTIAVENEGKPVTRLNELEFIRGEIFANVWQTDLVVRIDPATGAVRGVIDFAGLLSPSDRGPETDVLNGIAYDATADRLIVTGKLWPKLFEVRLKPATTGK